MSSSALTWALSTISCVLSWFSAWATWMASRGKFSRMSGIGIRTPATYASDASWIAAHKAALPWAAIGAVVVTMVALFAVFDADEKKKWLAWTVLGIFVLTSIITTIIASAAARRAGQ